MPQNSAIPTLLPSNTGNCCDNRTSYSTYSCPRGGNWRTRNQSSTHISLYPFDDQFTYHIDYGDGYQQIARSRNRHLYGRPGDYHLSVTVLYGRDTVDFNQFSIYIRASISPSTPNVVYNDQGMGGGMIMPRNDEEPQPVEEQLEIVDLGEWEDSPSSSQEVLLFSSVMP